MRTASTLLLVCMLLLAGSPTHAKAAPAEAPDERTYVIHSCTSSNTLPCRIVQDGTSLRVYVNNKYIGRTRVTLREYERFTLGKGWILVHTEIVHTLAGRPCTFLPKKGKALICSLADWGDVYYHVLVGKKVVAYTVLLNPGMNYVDGNIVIIQ